MWSPTRLAGNIVGVLKQEAMTKDLWQLSFPALFLVCADCRRPANKIGQTLWRSRWIFCAVVRRQWPRIETS